MIDADKRIKVGHSGNLVMRLCDAQYDMTGGRRPVRLVKAIEMPCGAVRRVEVRTHKLLKTLGRLATFGRGCEWFCTTPSAASRILNKAIRQIEMERPWAFS